MTQVSDSTGGFFEAAGKSIKEKTVKAVDSASTGIKKGTEALSKTYQGTKASFFLTHPTSISDFLVEVEPRIYQMAFPDNDVLPKYAKLLSAEFGQRYRVWNVSEHAYSETIFDGQVADYVNVGHPHPPLADLVMACREMANWLASDPENVVVVHCQRPSVRSCLILGCLQFILGEASNPSELMPNIGQVGQSLRESRTDS